MRTAKAQATAIAARLCAALDVEPDIDETDGYFLVRVALPGQVTNTQRSAILAALADADGFGHSSAPTGTVWALIHKEPSS